jgi:hypothetical protein
MHPPVFAAGMYPISFSCVIHIESCCKRARLYNERKIYGKRIKKFEPAECRTCGFAGVYAEIYTIDYEGREEAG